MYAVSVSGRPAIPFKTTFTTDFGVMKRSIRSFLRLSLVLALGLLTWTACDSSDSGGQVEGRMNLRLTDAPLDSVAEVNVTIESINLVRKNDDDEDDGDDPADDENGDENGDDEIEAGDESIIPIFAPDQPVTIDLLELTDSTTTLVEDAVIPEGEYSQMRLVLTEDNFLVFNDGSQADLKTPSAQQSGYKVNLPEFEIDDEGDIVDLTLDFDASQSIVVTGGGPVVRGAPGYILKPVVRAESIQFSGGDLDDADIAAAGRLENVDTSAPSVTVEGVLFDVTSATDFDGVDGIDGLTSFSFASVEATEANDGSYDALDIEAVSSDSTPFILEGPFESATPSSISVLGVTMEVTDDTQFEGDLTRDTFDSALVAGDRVEVEFAVENGTRVATNIEHEED